MTIAYLNGDFLPLEQARVSPMDRGFLFGDGVYEIIPVYKGKLFRLDQHLNRLRRSLHLIQIDFTVNTSAWEKIFNQLIEENGSGDQSAYLQITRGAAPKREHYFPANINPTLFAYTMPLVLPTLESLQKGIQAITINDIRWQHCDIKSLNLLPNVLARQEAMTHQAQEAILVRDGHALEGAASNLFVVKNGVIITPPQDCHILGGITRDAILEIAQQNQIPHIEAIIPEKMLFSADEIWISSSAREISPVLKLNDQQVGDGKPGPVWSKMIKLFQQLKG